MILGLDVSTSITGCCLLDDDGEYEAGWAVKLSKHKDFIEKCNILNYNLSHEMQDVTHVFMEDKLSGFSAGRTMQQTLMKLASFHGAVRYMVAGYATFTPILIHPSTVKATMKKDGLIIPKGADKKRLTVDFVRKEIPEFPYEETRNGNPRPQCYDIADAYCVARAGYLKHCVGERS